MKCEMWRDCGWILPPYIERSLTVTSIQSAIRKPIITLWLKNGIIYRRYDLKL